MQTYVQVFINIQMYTYRSEQASLSILASQLIIVCVRAAPSVWTHPRHDELSTQILNLGFHLAADVELMAVQGNSLQVS